MPTEATATKTKPGPKPATGSRASNDERVFIPVSEAARIAGYSGVRIYQLIHEGEALGQVKLTHNRWIIDRKTFERWLPGYRKRLEAMGRPYMSGTTEE
jgi:hypothetical protein